jgi:hypothetical protein
VFSVIFVFILEFWDSWGEWYLRESFNIFRKIIAYILVLGARFVNLQVDFSYVGFLPIMN